MSPRERAAGAVLMLPMPDGDVLMDRLTDWCDDPDAFARLIVDAVLDEIRDLNDGLKKRAQREWDACHEDPMPQCRDGAHLWFGMIDAIKRGEG